LVNLRLKDSDGASSLPENFHQPDRTAYAITSRSLRHHDFQFAAGWTRMVFLPLAANLMGLAVPAHDWPVA
jgi:hypothetical protein